MRSCLLIIFMLISLFPNPVRAVHMTVRVGISQLEPLSFIDNLGQPQGLYPDLLREIAQKNEWQLMFVPGTWQESLQRLENGRIDLLMPVARTPERELKYDYSRESVVDNWSQIFSLPGAGIESFRQLQRKRVAIVAKDINGINFLETVEQMGVEPEILRYDDYADIFRAVQQGEADALVSAQHFGFRHASEYGLVATSLQFSPIPIYFAALKGQHADMLQHIDRQLASWKQDEDSFYYKRIAYWISGQTVQPVIPLWIVGVMLLSGSFAVVLLFRNRAMQKAERERKREEERRDHILAETALDGFCKISIKGEFLQVNEAYCQMLGYSREELMQMSLVDVEALETAEEIRAHTCNIVRQGNDRFETKQRAKSGALLDVEISASYVASDPPVFYGFMRDVSERKRSETALRKSEERFTLAMQATTDGLWDWDVASGDVYYSPGWFEILGLRGGEPSYKTWANRIHPDDKEKVMQSLHEHLAGKTDSWYREHRLRDAAENYLWVSGRGKVVVRDQAGGPLRMVGTMTNVDALHKTVRERDRLFNYSLDMLSIAGSDGYFKQLNPAWESTLGWSIEELKSKPWLELVHPEDRLSTIEAMKTLADGKPVVGFENRYACYDGDYRWLSWNSFPLQDEGLLFAIARDVTTAKLEAERRLQLEEQLLRSQKMEAIGTLAGGIAHDFNNILTPIIAHSTMAKRKLTANDDGSLKNHLEQIEKSVQRAADLVKQILTISRRGKESETTTDLRVMLTEIINFIRASFPATIAIDLQLAQQDLFLAADPAQVHQLILNLCTNAKDAMEKTGGTLRLSAVPVELEDKRRMIRLSISDTGEGIPIEAQHRIFDPYFTTKKFGKGSGLGLAVVNGIVSSLQGEIKVDSQPGQGTSFELLLPAASAAPKAVAIRPGQIVRGQGERILLVDDEEQIIETIKMLLEELGYRVTAFRSSQDALDAFLADAEAFDAVLTDQTMPQLTGLKLAQKISRLRPDLPILLGTGYLEGIEPETAQRHGVGKLLHKPYEMEVLAAIFAKIFVR